MFHNGPCRRRKEIQKYSHCSSVLCIELKRKRCAGEPSSSYCTLHRVAAGRIFILSSAKRFLFVTKNCRNSSLSDVGIRVT
jgi:hypothetical protein